MVQREVIEVFRRLGAIETGHFVYTSGKHGEVYVAKDLVVPSTRTVIDLTSMMSNEFHDEMIDTVIGIAPIGGIFASHLADWIQENTGRPTFAIFAEKKPFVDSTGRTVLNVPGGHHTDVLVVRESLRRFIDPQQRILIVEDIINTGKSVKALIKLVRELGGEDIWGVVALWNRGGVTADDLDVPNLFSLCDVQYTAWDEIDCPLCRENVPINTEFGHGKEFVAAHS